VSTPRLTDSIGNTGGSYHDFFKTDSNGDLLAVEYFAARWDGDKVRGIRVRLMDGTNAIYGGFNDVGYPLSSYTFVPRELLTKGWLRDSGYGRGSLRQIQFQTTLTSTSPYYAEFMAGQGGFDNEANLLVYNSTMAGVRAWVNPDNFISALAFYVYP